jgi:hypothetical protein
MTLPVINSHNSWSPLEECWLGDVYPVEWYEHLDPEVRDVFQRLTEITREDLNAIQQTLESFGVTVRRPKFTTIDHYLFENDVLKKPPIVPRDWYLVIGNTLYHAAKIENCWVDTIDQYLEDLQCSVTRSPHRVAMGANIQRVGRDIVFDIDKHDYVLDVKYNNWWPEYRVQIEKNGGHIDGCFAILKPGLILANHYFDGYERTFPGWEVIYMDNPTYGTSKSTGFKQPYPAFNGKFWETTVGTNKAFNDHVIKHAQDWVGNYTETYFELNCLSIDEKNVVMLAKNDHVAEELQRRGVTVHWVPFRTRCFWDGAMHCLTLDIRRQSSIEDFFPERG